MNRGVQAKIEVASASVVNRRPHATSWADLIATYIGGSHATEAVGRDDAFFGRLTNWRFGDLRFVLSQVRGASVRGIQTTDESVKNLNDVWLCMCLSGSFELDTHGRSTVIGPTSVAVMQCGRPHVVTFAPDCDVVWVRAPRYHFRNLNQPRSAFVVLDASRGAGGLALQALQGIQQQAERLDEKDASQIVHSTLGLVSAAIEQTLRRDTRLLGNVSALERLQQFIDNNLHDDSFSLRTAARALGRNPRYLNKVFEAAGDSFMRWTWNRRLERAHELLAADEPRGSVTDIALGCGFKNLSHFSRAFRERFGYAPSLLPRRRENATH